MAGGCFCLANVVQGLPRETVLTAIPALPCALIWGEQDRSHRRTSPESILDCLPQTKILRFADSGHFPDLEQPRRYAEAVITHMTQLPQCNATG